MLYILKFIYMTFILPPGCIIIVLILLSSRLLKKHRKIATTILCINLCLYIMSTDLFATALIGSLERKYKPDINVKGDVIVMLGGGATADTPNIQGKGNLYGNAANRLLTSLQLYQKLHIPIIVSGGKVFDNTGSEADIAKEILMSVGVPEKDIIVENRSLNTEDNAKYSKELIKKHNFNNPILVTSAFHMKRAVMLFNKVGVTVSPFPCDYMSNVKSNFSFNELIPSSGALNETSTALKEYLGLLKQ